MWTFLHYSATDRINMQIKDICIYFKGLELIPSLILTHQQASETEIRNYFM